MDDTLEIAVRDNGLGFDVDAATGPGHYGLLGMRERARLAGGALVIDSAPEQGTLITLRLPLDHQLKQQRRDEVHSERIP
jgi:signal transduction histidine kinase